MSDLQCPATLLVARHGDAGHMHAGVLSDEGGSLTDMGVGQVRELADSLGGRRVAAVYSSHLQRAVESARVAAEALGVGSRVVAGLEELAVGESGREVLERYRAALEEIADLHRGETVLVFSHSGVMSICLPRIGDNARADLATRMFPPSLAAAELSIDADGVTILSWPDSADRTVV
jgi:probable phosphoglycerate mutase